MRGIRPVVGMPIGQLLKIRNYKGRTQYLVAWRFGDTFTNNWEDALELSHANIYDALIDDFEEKSRNCLDYHRVDAHAGDEYRCDLCPGLRFAKQDLFAHKTVHKKWQRVCFIKMENPYEPSVDDVEEEDEEEITYVCRLCPDLEIKPDEQLAHRMMHTNEKQQNKRCKKKNTKQEKRQKKKLKKKKGNGKKRDKKKKKKHNRKQKKKHNKKQKKKEHKKLQEKKERKKNQ